jgi:hypothetical protein
MRRMIAVAVALLVSLIGVSPVAAQTAEGIQVHGHWKIEIFEPDGTLVRSLEFENAFMGQGSLAVFLARGSTVGLWNIILMADSPNPGPCEYDGGDVSCAITEPSNPNPGASLFKNLVVSRPSPGDWISLSGSATVTNATTLTRVQTFVGSCLPTVAPASCIMGLNGYATGAIFTITALAPSQPVLAGQIVQATVSLTFS